MKNISAARAEIVTMNVVLRTSLLRACVDSTTPTDTPVSRIAKGTANHQWKQPVATTALAAIIEKQAVLIQPAMWIIPISIPL